MSRIEPGDAFQVKAADHVFTVHALSARNERRLGKIIAECAKVEKAGTEGWRVFDFLADAMEIVWPDKAERERLIDTHDSETLFGACAECLTKNRIDGDEEKKSEYPPWFDAVNCASAATRNANTNSKSNRS